MALGVIRIEVSLAQMPVQDLDYQVRRCSVLQRYMYQRD